MSAGYPRAHEPSKMPIQPTPRYFHTIFMNRSDNQSPELQPQLLAPPRRCKTLHQERTAQRRRQKTSRTHCYRAPWRQRTINTPTLIRLGPTLPALRPPLLCPFRRREWFLPLRRKLGFPQLIAYALIYRQRIALLRRRTRRRGTLTLRIRRRGRTTGTPGDELIRTSRDLRVAECGDR